MLIPENKVGFKPFGTFIPPIFAEQHHWNEREHYLDDTDFFYQGGFPLNGSDDQHNILLLQCDLFNLINKQDNKAITLVFYGVKKHKSIVLTVPWS